MNLHPSLLVQAVRTTAARARPGRRLALRLLVFVSVLSVPAFVLASLSLNSTPVPREFKGFAAVFTTASHASPRVFLTMTPSTPGGYGAHPVVQYGITVCGKESFDGVLVLAGDARIRVSDPTSQPVAPRPNAGSLSHVPNLSRLRIGDLSSGGVADVVPVQVFRVRVPSTPCHAAYDPSAPKWEGRTIGLAGPLEGQTVHQSFAPFGLWPVRQAQSWPYLGQVPVFNPIDHGAFRLGSRLPGLWVRPFESYFGVDLGLLDGKATVDFARPEATSGLEALAWAGGKPFAAKARLTNADNLSRWQTASLVTTIGLTLGGSILAALALDAVRKGRRTRVSTGPSGLSARAKASAPDRSEKQPRRRAVLGVSLAVAAVVWHLVRPGDGQRRAPWSG